MYTHKIIKISTIRKWPTRGSVVKVLIISLMLIGCSSGGGGSHSGLPSTNPPPSSSPPTDPPPTDPPPTNPPPSDPPPTNPPPSDPPQKPISGDLVRRQISPPSSYGPTSQLTLVRVAVTDAAFNVDTIDNPERIIDTLDIYTNTSDVGGLNEWHGNAVASTITDGSLGNARLDLIKTEDPNGLTRRGALSYAIGEAASRGARVINASFDRRLEAVSPQLSFNGYTSRESFQRVVNANDGKGAVYVASAGNTGGPIETGGNPFYNSEPEVYGMMLIALGTTQEGDIHPSSSYPADDKRLQERSLGAPFSSSEGNGTSFSAARITEYAAGILGQWPHLTAQQASQRLLDTASRESDLYQKDSCGETGSTNCGAFYLGQGVADIDAALAPEGELVVSQGTFVAEGGHSADHSFMQLSGAYGNSLAASGVLDGVAAFDALGRDYRINLGHHAQQRTTRATQLRGQMEQLALGTGSAVRTQSVVQDNFSFTSSSNVQGDVLSSRFDGSVGNTHLSVFSFDGDQPNPMSGYAESTMIPMISFQTGGELTQSFETVNGFKTRYAMGERLSLTAAHWAGSSNRLDTISDFRANRSDVGFTLEVSSAISLSSYVGQLNEQKGLLGASGNGALAFGEQNKMTFVGVGLQADMGNSWSGFAEFEQGRGSASGNGLLKRIDDINAQQIAMGLQWKGNGRREDERAALTLRQPLRISSANAIFDVPVGRAIDGTVLRETRNASLAPSGRQVDIEFGYQFKTGQRSQWQLNLLHTLEPGHNANAPSDSAVLINYDFAW